LDDRGCAAEDGRALLPTEPAWLDDYLHEMTVFPKGKYDDQVDSTAQFLDWLNTPMPQAGAFEFMRREAEKARAAERTTLFQTAKPEFAIGSMEWRPSSSGRKTMRSVTRAQSLAVSGMLRPGERYPQGYSSKGHDATRPKYLSQVAIPNSPCRRGGLFRRCAPRERRRKHVSQVA